MSDLVGNPKDRFSNIADHLVGTAFKSLSLWGKVWVVVTPNHLHMYRQKSLDTVEDSSQKSPKIGHNDLHLFFTNSHST